MGNEPVWLLMMPIVAIYKKTRIDISGAVRADAVTEIHFEGRAVLAVVDRMAFPGVPGSKPFAQIGKNPLNSFT